MEMDVADSVMIAQGFKRSYQLFFFHFGSGKMKEKDGRSNSIWF